MKSKISCVMLVDDDNITNFIHKQVIKEADFAERVEIAGNGEEALDFLKSINEMEFGMPDIIFLDINMPRMNGWEFLEEYKLFDEELQGQIKIIILTTSLNPDDRLNSESNKCIDGFMNKHLTVEMLQDLQSQFRITES